MKYIFSLVILLIFGQIFGWNDFCRNNGCRRRRRRCHRRFSCGCFPRFYRFGRCGRNDVDIDNVAVADSNSVAINTGDFGVANAVSTANAVNVNDVDQGRRRKWI